MLSYKEFETLLIEVLKIPTMSKKEWFVRKYMADAMPCLESDAFGNLTCLRPNTPLISAHMDSVGSPAAQALLPYIQVFRDKSIRGLDNIGADDKVGLALALALYEHYGDQLSYAFFVQEEIGCLGSKDFVRQEAHTAALADCNWYAVLDRRNASDFICSQNNYGSKEFEEAAMAIIGEESQFGFKPERGLFSDADSICGILSGANFSVGYYEPHSSNEYVMPEEAYNTLLAVAKMIEVIGSTKFGPAPPKPVYVAPKTAYAWQKDNTATDGKITMFDDDDDYMPMKPAKAKKPSKAQFIRDSVEATIMAFTEWHDEYSMKLPGTETMAEMQARAIAEIRIHEKLYSELLKLTKDKQAPTLQQARKDLNGLRSYLKDLFALS